MTRNALQSLDADTREAVEAAARRSGMSLEDWVAAAVIEQGRRAAPVRSADSLEAAIARISEVTRQRPAPAADPRNGVALDAVAQWMAEAERRIESTTQSSLAQQERLASTLAEALHALKHRIDRVESRAPGGPDLAETLAAIRADMAALAARLDEPKSQPDPWHAALQGIQREVERLRGAFAGLVTRDEVATLEDLVRGLAADLAEPQSRADMQALAGSLAQVELEVRHLAKEVSADLQHRIAAEVDGLARKLDQVAAAGAGRAGVDALAHQIADMRQALARMADPQRIERLSDEVAGLARQVAEMRAQQVAPGEFAGLKSALEDIRLSLQRSEEAQGASSEVPGELRNLNRRLDLLMSRPDPVGLDPISEQLSTLTDRISALASTLSADRHEPPAVLASGMESLRGEVHALAESVAAVPKPVLGRLDQIETALRETRAAPEAMLGRFDRLESTLRETRTPDAVIGRIDRLEDTVRQIGEQADTAPLEIMVRELVEKLDQGHGTSAHLDGLEQRLEAMTRQLTHTASDQVQQALAETLIHVKTLRGEAAIIAERAAKAAIREAHAAGPADMEALRQGFAELRALQTEAEKRTQATLKAVHNALETLMLRQPAAAAAPAPQAAASETLPSVRLETAVRKLHAAAMSQVEAPVPPPAPMPTAPAPEPDPEEVLIEPGAQRPALGSAFIAPQDGDPGHARANFIAAARRAAQAATVDAGGQMEEGPAPEGAADGPISNHTLIERIRQTFDSHRKPLLLSMALLILVTGSLQTITRLGGPLPGVKASDKAATATIAQAPEPPKAPAVQAPQPEAPRAADADPAPTGLFEPTDVSSLGPVVPQKRVPGVVAADLPSGAPASLVAAAEGGDGAAVYELASRLAEGRTLPREPALAAKLFEKAAQAGLAPAQFRIGNMYEKGVGVARDLAQARAWYERAAQAGNTRAMHNLAVLIAEGTEGQPDYAKASRWFQEAADHGVRDSQYNLAVLLARGLGLPQDLVQSHKWFSLAAAQGDEDAGRKRDEIAARLSPEMLAAAKALAGQWKAKAAPSAANEVAQPPFGWSGARTASRRG